MQSPSATRGSRDPASGRRQHQTPERFPSASVPDENCECRESRLSGWLAEDTAADLHGLARRGVLVQSQQSHGLRPPARICPTVEPASGCDRSSRRALVVHTLPESSGRDPAGRRNRQRRDLPESVSATQSRACPTLRIGKLTASERTATLRPMSSSGLSDSCCAIVMIRLQNSVRRNSPPEHVRKIRCPELQFRR